MLDTCATDGVSRARVMGRVTTQMITGGAVPCEVSASQMHGLFLL